MGGSLRIAMNNGDDKMFVSISIDAIAQDSYGISDCNHNRHWHCHNVPAWQETTLNTFGNDIHGSTSGKLYANVHT